MDDKAELAALRERLAKLEAEVAEVKAGVMKVLRAVQIAAFAQKR